MSCSPSLQSCAASLPCGISMFGGTSSAPYLMVRKMKDRKEGCREGGTVGGQRQRHYLGEVREKESSQKNNALADQGFAVY